MKYLIWRGGRGAPGSDDVNLRTFKWQFYMYIWITSPPSAWVATMRFMLQQNCKAKLHGNTPKAFLEHLWTFLETPLKYLWNFLKFPLKFFQMTLKPTEISHELPFNLPWNILESSLKHPWNTFELPSNSPWSYFK